MTIHSQCGREIRWANRDDDPERFRPPLEFAGQAYIIDESNTAVYVTTYKQHECDPEDIVNWADLKRRQAIALGKPTEEIDRREERELAKEEQRKQDWKIALKVACPQCEVGVGKICHNMTMRKRGIKELTKNPHPRRIMDSWKADV